MHHALRVRVRQRTVPPSVCANHQGHERSLCPPALRFHALGTKDATAWTCSTLFRLSGFDVETAPDCRAALVTARAFRPEVALLDIGLPGMDGFEFGRRLRAEYGPALLF
jgi:hypothetical protein